MTITAPDSSRIFKEDDLYRDTFQIAGVQSGTYLIFITRDTTSSRQYSFNLTFDQATSPEQIQTLKKRDEALQAVSQFSKRRGNTKC